MSLFLCHSKHNRTVAVMRSGTGRKPNATTAKNPKKNTKPMKKTKSSKNIGYSTIHGNTIVQKNKFLLYKRYYAEVCNGCNVWRDPSPLFSAWQHSSEATSQRWRTVGKTASDLTGPEIKLKTSRTDKSCL